MSDEVINAKSTDLTPDSANANRHTERGSAMVEASIRRRGFRFAGTLDKNRRIVHGNNRHEQATDIGLDDVVIVKADPGKQYYLQFDDLDLTDPANPARELAYQANRSAQVSIDFDPAVLLADLNAGFDFDGLFSAAEIKTLLEGMDSQANGQNIGGLQNIPEQWMVLIECDSEYHQAELLERLSNEGYKCRSLIS